MTRSFQSERIPPLAAHIVVGEGLFAGGAGKDIRTGLDRPRIVAGRQACLPSLELVQLGAIRAARGIKYRMMIDMIGLECVSPPRKIPADWQIGDDHVVEEACPVAVRWTRAESVVL